MAEWTSSTNPTTGKRRAWTSGCSYPEQSPAGMPVRYHGRVSSKAHLQIIPRVEVLFISKEVESIALFGEPHDARGRYFVLRCQKFRLVVLTRHLHRSLQVLLQSRLRNSSSVATVRAA